MIRAVLASLALLVAAPTAHASELPMQLPGDVTASSVRADPDTWLIGAALSKRTAKIARRFGAEHFGLDGTGTYVVARSRARAFAKALGRGLVFAEPNALREVAAAGPADPLSTPGDWRAKVAGDLTPPPVVPDSPLIALIDAAVDLTHEEFRGNPNISVLGGGTVTSPHGTATAAVAAAPQNGVGIVGVWPGARVLNVPLAVQNTPAGGTISCKASGDGIERAVEAGAAVINMSYGSRSRCASEWVQIYFAVAKGIIPVAAAGNEFADGNPLEFPASLPHVVTVAATTPDDSSAWFSNVNDAIDLAAPGEGILTAVPKHLDTTGQDGYEALDGTSFAAPMVSAAMAWVRAARPDLKPDQVIQAVRLTARDVLQPGWDRLTGFGILNVGAALAVNKKRLPPADPLEPNDNLAWVNGTLLPRAEPVWSGSGIKRVNATLDKQEDKVDVYRIVIPPRRSARISVIPRFGDPALDVFPATAFAVNRLRERVGSSHRRGSKRTERLTIVNPDSTSRTYYVAVTPQGKSRYQEREYTLRVA
ncbi:MAG TPA: S8 family serine peptidase [Solirubrobacter sp.]|nr:S8 family serine peptidase [Solirubrobacter sp.]